LIRENIKDDYSEIKQLLKELQMRFLLF
jgi:hypothetical protein